MTGSECTQYQGGTADETKQEVGNCKGNASLVGGLSDFIAPFLFFSPCCVSAKIV